MLDFLWDWLCILGEALMALVVVMVLVVIIFFLWMGFGVLIGVVQPV